MNFKQLEYFSAVAQSQSISGAARDLHVAQPPISRQIALLEEELGVCLFIRNNKGVVLTEAGETLYRQTQQIFQSCRLMMDSVKDVASGLRGILKIGVIYSNIPIVMEKLRKYHADYPLVELYIRVGTPRELLEALNSGELHILFLRTSVQESSEGHGKLLGEDPVELLMCPELDPAPHLAAIPIELLEDIPMCLLRSDDLWGYSSLLINECQKNGFTPQIACQCYDTPTAMQMVQAGFGISFLPRSIVRTQPGGTVYSKPIRNLPSASYPTMMWSNAISLGNCIRHFVAMFEDETN